MNTFHDFIDWIGGYPYEYATAEALIEFYEKRGLHVQTVKRCNYKLGCNELVFTRSGFADLP